MRRAQKETAKKVIIKRFPFRLTDEEKLERGGRLADEVQKVYDAREHAKEQAKELKGVVEEHERNVRDLREVVGTGTEWREVECEERFYRASGEVVIVRTDTGDLVETRPMTPEERQTQFDWESDN